MNISIEDYPLESLKISITNSVWGYRLSIGDNDKMTFQVIINDKQLSKLISDSIDLMNRRQS